MSVEVASLSREKEIYKVTIVGSIVNFVLLAFKFVAGILGHSAAMLADAVHSLSDFVTDVIVLVFVRISNKPQDKDHDYGHGKYETLATAIIGILLLLVGFGILWNGAFSIWAFMKGEQLEAPGMVALIAALISILLKEILYQYTVIKGKNLNSGSSSQCLAPSERRFFVYRNGYRYWRCNLVGRTLAGTRSDSCCDCQFLYNEGSYSTVDSLC